MVWPMQILRTNRMISLLTSVALLLQVLVPFFAVYQLPAAMDTQEISSLFGDKILLCTADGFKLVSASDLASGKEVPAADMPYPHEKFQCALCYIAAHGHNISPPVEGALSATLHAITEQLIAFSYGDSDIISHSYWRRLGARAPPAYVTV